MAHRKPHLPTKTCPVCGRPFAWRKKWARDWDAVVYCSERCRRAKGRASGDATGAPSGTRPRSTG
ncbi:DUF2256 domain-containing protein [Rubrivirga sp. IMCC43871]|uniref:DUF2256 domain-containing protein n=1 Tax=Rubrivirga sp. IMCC43871 TaxID=3391575 RepID=UPI00399039EA